MKNAMATPSSIWYHSVDLCQKKSAVLAFVALAPTVQMSTESEKGK